MRAMKKIVTAIVAAISLSSAAHAVLPVGAKAPEFRTQGAQGGRVFDVQLSKLLKRGPVVLYFFPAAFTSGCTIEAREFAQASDEFAKNGATILGVAADPIDKLSKFSVEECRSKFPVAVATPQMIAAYNVALPTTTRSNRTSFVIGRNGRIAYVYSAMRPEGHVSGTLGAVRQLKR